MKLGNLKKIGTSFLLTPALLAATIPAGAQQYYSRDNGYNRGSYQQQYDRHDRHDERRYDRHDHDRDRYRGGNGYYGNSGYSNSGYVTYGNGYRNGDSGYYQQDNGIGPGKGAAIGAVGGAVLGAIIGGGKGAVIGGAAGAGVGAIAGQSAQDHRYNNQYGGYYGR